MTELGIGALIFLLASQLTALTAPVITRLSAGLDLAKQSYVLLAYPWLALLTAITASIVLLRPSWAERLIPTHCHASICGPHLPQIESDSASWLLLQVGAVMIIVFSLVTLLYIFFAGLHKIQTLRTLSVDQMHYQVLDHHQPIAWCSGLFNQTIFISRGLFERLNEDELHYVLWHETIHKRRYDNLRKASVKLSTLAWPRPVRKTYSTVFGNTLEALCEQLCLSEFRPDYATNSPTKELRTSDRETILFSRPEPDHADTQQGKRIIQNVFVILVVSTFSMLQVALLSSMGHFALEWIIPN